MPDYYVRAAFRGHATSANIDFVNTVHYKVSSLAALGDLTGTTDAIDTHLRTTLLAVMINFTKLADLTVSAEPMSFAPLASVEKVIDVAGTRSGPDDDLSPALCALITLKSGTAGRYARGRQFAQPAFTSGTVAPIGTWATGNAYWTALLAYATALKTGFTVGDSDFVPIIYSKSRVLKSLTPFAFPITSAVVGARQHFLRSRIK